MASREAVGKALTVFGTLHPRDVSPDLVGIWQMGLRELTDTALAYAVEQGVRECRYFPTPAELVAFGRGMPRPIGGIVAPAVAPWCAKCGGEVRESKPSGRLTMAHKAECPNG